MNCIGPTTPDEADILAYADSAASPAVRQHVSACPACQARALALRRGQRAVQRLFHRAACPPALELGEYSLGIVGGQRASDIARHLTYCPACRLEQADLTAFLAHLSQPVADTAQRAIASLRRVAAHLAFPPLGGPAGAPIPALRGPEDEGRLGPLIYDAEDVMVTLDSWVERAGPAGRVVAGLVVGPPDFAGAEARLDPEDRPNTAPIDSLGNFLFSDVSAGTHRLTLRIPAMGVEIDIDELGVQ